MAQIQTILARALAATAVAWPPLRRAYQWLDTLATILGNRAGRSRAGVQAAMGRVLRTIGLIKRHLGPLAGAMERLLAVTRRYRAGLFHCYAPDGPPRTNNDLEHLFGQHRYHERRTTGRKRGTVGTVLHGPVRVIARVATQTAVWTGAALAPASVPQWRALRATIRQRFATRARGRRFRQDPDAYLAALELLYLNEGLLL